MFHPFKMKKVFYPFLLLFFFYSCEDKKIDTTAVREEMKAREIKIIPEAKILEKVLEVGTRLSQTFIYQPGTKSAEMKLPDWKGIEPALSFTLFGIENNLSGKEQMLFEAYLYNSENDIKSVANVQDFPEEISLLFTTPIISQGKSVGMWSILFLRKTIVGMIDN